MTTRTLVSSLIAVALLPAAAPADVSFFDDFTGGASPLWQDVAGQWTVQGGLYWATVPDNLPSAHSTLPFEMSNLELEVDISEIVDGGLWIRCAEAPGSPIGLTGVLLVTKGTSLYWHEVTNPGSYGGIINEASGLFPAGGNARIRVSVCGDTYEAYVDDATAPATTLTSSAFGIGRVALYANSLQKFDNVSLTSVDVGDLNFDGVVDGADLGALLAAWGPCGAGCEFDLTCDGAIDGADLGILLANWST